MTAGKDTVLNVTLEEIVVVEQKTVEVTAERRLVEARQGATVNEAEGWVQNLNQSAIQSQLTDYQARLKTYIDSTPSGTSIRRPAW